MLRRNTPRGQLKWSNMKLYMEILYENFILKNFAYTKLIHYLVTILDSSTSVGNNMALL